MGKKNNSSETKGTDCAEKVYEEGAASSTADGTEVVVEAEGTVTEAASPTEAASSVGAASTKNASTTISADTQVSKRSTSKLGRFIKDTPNANLVLLGLLTLALVVALIYQNNVSTPAKNDTPNIVSSQSQSEQEAVVSQSSDASSEVGEPSSDILPLEPASQMTYTDSELGYSIVLPSYCLLDEYTVEKGAETGKNGDWTKINFVYTGPNGSATVIGLEFYPLATWEALKTEEGPMTEVLIAGDTVVTATTLQSNPFKEGSDDHTKFSTYAEDVVKVKESLKLLG